ncbi:MAG: hypothetical protein LC798_13745 [Chloroflexi bacterium]|nr:hypothetical protein [Chloroflexota bacterium]
MNRTNALILIIIVVNIVAALVGWHLTVTDLRDTAAIDSKAARAATAERSGLDNRIDSLTILLTDSAFRRSVPASLAPDLRQVIADLQADHDRVARALVLSTRQRNEQMATIEELAGLAACNTSQPRNRYAYCRDLVGQVPTSMEASR